MSSYSVIVKNTSSKGKGVFATKTIEKNSPILTFSGAFLPEEQASPNALQIDENLFLEGIGKTDDFLNHSCEPTCYVDIPSLQLIARRDILPGEEITFNYNTTEYDLIRGKCAFTCHCNSKNCLKEVKGFKYLTYQQQLDIKPYLSPYLLRKLEEIQQSNVQLFSNSLQDL